MKQVHHQEDGMVWVRADGKHYGDTHDNFVKDYGKPLPCVPEGGLDRLYEPGRRHAIHGPEGVLHGGPLQWDLGDDIISSLDKLLSAQAARRKAEEAGHV